MTIDILLIGCFIAFVFGILCAKYQVHLCIAQFVYIKIYIGCYVVPYMRIQEWDRKRKGQSKRQYYLGMDDET